MLQTMLNWVAAILIGLAMALASYAIEIWGRPPRVSAPAESARKLQPKEPLLLQLWRLFKVMVSGQSVGRIVGSFSAFESNRVQDLLNQAGSPWGLHMASDVYSVGIGLGSVLLVALSYLIGFSPILVATIPLWLMAGIGALVIALRVLAVNRKQETIRELWTLLSGLELFMQAGYPLYYALKESAAACPMLSPAVDRALLHWGSSGPKQSLDLLAEELRMPEAFLLVNLLRQSLDKDPQNVAIFMARESVRLDKALEAQQLQSAQIKPMLQNAAMFVPMMNMFLLWTAPMAYSVFTNMGQNVPTGL